MNILKEIAKFFITATLTEKREETKAKLQKKLITATGSEAVEYAAYLKLIEAADGKAIDAINKTIDKMWGVSNGS